MAGRIPRWFTYPQLPIQVSVIRYQYLAQCQLTSLNKRLTSLNKASVLTATLCHRSCDVFIHSIISSIGNRCVLCYSQIGDEPLANVQLPVTHLSALRMGSTSSLDILIAGGNFNSLVILSNGKVCRCYQFVICSSTAV